MHRVKYLFGMAAHSCEYWAVKNSNIKWYGHVMRRKDHHIGRRGLWKCKNTGEGRKEDLREDGSTE